MDKDKDTVEIIRAKAFTLTDKELMEWISMYFKGASEAVSLFKLWEKTPWAPEYKVIEKEMIKQKAILNALVAEQKKRYLKKNNIRTMLDEWHEVKNDITAEKIISGGKK